MREAFLRHFQKIFSVFACVDLRLSAVSKVWIQAAVCAATTRLCDSVGQAMGLRPYPVGQRKRVVEATPRRLQCRRRPRRLGLARQGRRGAAGTSKATVRRFYDASLRLRLHTLLVPLLVTPSFDGEWE